MNFLHSFKFYLYNGIRKKRWVGLTLFFFTSNAYALEKVNFLIPPSYGEFYFNVAKEIFNYANVKFEVQNSSLPAIMKKMESIDNANQEIYATVAINNEENKKAFFNAGNIISIDTAFFTLKDGKKSANSLDEAKNLKRICVWLDSVLNSYLLDLDFSNLYPVPFMSQCPTLLFSGKVDAWFNSENTVVRTTQSVKLEVGELKKGFSPTKVTFFLAITKNASRSLIQKLLQANETLHATKRYNELVKNYQSELFIPDKNSKGGQKNVK